MTFYVIMMLSCIVDHLSVSVTLCSGLFVPRPESAIVTSERLPTICSRVASSSRRSVVWEKLDQIDGDTDYVDSDFTRSSRCRLANADRPVQLMDGQHE